MSKQISSNSYTGLEDEAPGVSVKSAREGGKMVSGRSH